MIAENSRNTKQPISSSGSSHSLTGGTAPTPGKPSAPMGPPPAIAVAAASSAPAPVSLMHKLLSGAHKTAAATTTSSSSGGAVSETVRREDRPSSSTSNIWVSEGDEGSKGAAGEGKMTSDLLHDDIERRENFTVRTADGRAVQVMIRDEDHVSDADGRINSIDLRRLLYKRPDIAVILYDCIVEEGILDPFEFESDQEDVDDVVDGLMSPPGGRSRTSSKVAFTEVNKDRDSADGGAAAEGEGGQSEEERGGGDGNEDNEGDISMRELDDLVDGMVEESEPVPEDGGEEGEEEE